MARRARITPALSSAHDPGSADVSTKGSSTSNAAGRLDGYREKQKRSASTRNTDLFSLARFESWLGTFGVSLEDWEDFCAVHGRAPTLPASLFLGWQAHYIQTHPAVKAISGEMGSVLRALAAKGWDVESARKTRNQSTGASTRMLKAVKASWADDDVRHTTRRARPIVKSVVEQIIEAIEGRLAAGEVQPLWAAMMRTLILCGFAGGFRISELARMEWEWVDLTADGALINVPSSKWQPNPKHVFIPRGSTSLCPVAALEQLRASYDAAGVTSPRVIVQVPRNEAHRKRISKKSPCGWVDVVARPSAFSTDDGIAELRALRGMAKQLRYQINWVLTEIGFGSRSDFEFIGPHGLRRGCATELRNANVSLIDISRHLRHGTTELTAVYIEGADVHIVDLADPLKEWDDDARAAVAGVLDKLSGHVSSSAPAE